MAEKETKSFPARMLRKLTRFFQDLRSELRKVVWPDRKKLLQTTATVVAICVLAAVILFLVDSALQGILTSLGFFDTGGNPTPTSPPAITATPAPTSSATPTAAPTVDATPTAAS